MSARPVPSRSRSPPPARRRRRRSPPPSPRPASPTPTTVAGTRRASTGRAVLPVGDLRARSGRRAQSSSPVHGVVATASRSRARRSRSRASPGIVEGARHGEYLAMADNGFGTKANSPDFHIRAYYLRPDFKTASTAGPATVAVGGYIEFSDPDGALRRSRSEQRGDAPTRILTGGRHRPRVDPARPPRRPVGRRRVRPVDPALRRPGPPAGGAVRAARRPRRADEPASPTRRRARRRRRRHGQQQPGHRGDGDDAERALARTSILEGAVHRRRRPDVAADLRVRRRTAASGPGSPPDYRHRRSPATSSPTPRRSTATACW